jgi:D-sedoheptulose 7-phosphate isomerase
MSTRRIAEHFASHNKVVEESVARLAEPVQAVAQVLVEALRQGHKIIAFGNGGSATQASHLVAELLGRFALTRQPLPAIALGGDAGTITCISNDFGYDALFERQLRALAEPGDVAVAFTTSGRSQNVLRGLATARERGAITVALTGQAGLAVGSADYILAVPSDSTAHIQEVHLMILHVLCAYVDEKLESGS